MSRDALRFERVAIRSMPGVDDGGYRLDDLSPGVNVVHGPNASGKTTTARAIEALLWPRAAAPDRASLAGWFRVAGDEWYVESEAGRARWQRGGADASAPPLPPAETRDRYRLSLHELLAAEDRALAEEILRESAGGYDLARAADAIGAQDGASRRSKELAALKAAREKVRQAEARHAELREDERELATLRERASAAARAADRVRLLELAIEHAGAVTDEADARRALDAFPAAMASLKGDEADRLETIRAKLDDARERHARAAGDLEAAEAERRDAGLPDDGVPHQTITALRARAAKLDELRRDIGALERELDDAVARRDAVARDIDAAWTETGAVEGAAAIDQLADFARDAADLLGRKAAADAELRWLGEDVGADDGAAADALAEGAALLRRWLRAGGDADAAGEGRSERRLRALGVVIGVLLFATSLAGAWLAGVAFPGTWVGRAIGIALALVALVILGIFLRRTPAAADARAVHRAEFERLRLDRWGVEGPGRWTESDVAAALDRLERRVAEARLDAERARRRADLARRRADLDPALDDLERRRAAIAARLGVRPETDPGKLVWLAQGIARWHDAATAVAGVEAKLAHARAQFDAALAEAWERIAPYVPCGVMPGAEPAAAVADFSAAVADLERRREAHSRASAAANDARRRLADAETTIAALEAERRALLDRLGLGPDDEPVVRDWCDRFDAYREAADRLAHATRRRQETLDRLAREPGYEPGLEAHDVAALHDALAAARGEADEAQELRDRIARIEERIDQAKRGHDLEAALAELARARDALREARERDVDAVVAGTLVRFIQRATRDQHRPDVFHRARELFARITHGRYRLDFDDGEPPAFRAYDTTTGVGRALDELSSGTRVQLLLAVRIAFVESQETGARLPLLFDETLGNSDDDRARAIMETAVALAADGRQVFYFTAQPDEVGKWRGVLQSRPDVPARFIDLAHVRRIARDGQATPLPVVDPPATSIPAPAGASYLEYGRVLGVPPIDVHADPETAHLWHLLDDPERLHRLLSLRVETWGALRNLVEHGGLTLLGDDAAAYARAGAAARALAAAVAAARIGRGRPVDRAVLAESGAITGAFLDAVDELCRELRGDAARLIDALEQRRIPRFRTSACDALREYLERHGYLDPRDRLSPDEVRARVIGAVARDIERGLIGIEIVDRIVAACTIATGSGHSSPDASTAANLASEAG